MAREPVRPQDLERALAQLVRFSPRDFNVYGYGGKSQMVELRTQTTQDQQDCPFDAEVVQVDSDTVFRFTNLGTINGFLPTNYFTGGSPFSVVLSGETYIILDCSTNGSAITDAEIITDSVPPSPIGVQEGVAPASFQLLLWAVNADGVAYRALGCGNISATPEQVLVTDKADPECAGDPNVRHYTWQITIEGEEA